MTDPTGARRPTDAEIDVYGLTHIGRQRTENQDHFVIAAVHKHTAIIDSSLPGAMAMVPPDQRLAMLAMVADGVGSGDGELASRLTIERATQYTAETLRCFYGGDAHSDTFFEHLEKAICRCHEEVLKRREAEGPEHRAATTLTLWLGVWPSVYAVQVGDSRYYIYQGGVLRQITRDQTVAQDLYDAGALTRTESFRSPLANVLSSAIGSDQALPVVTRIRQDWDTVHLLCSDGLTKHVTDEQIAARLKTMTSAQHACETLLQDALDGGGSDNITIVVGRAKQA